MESNVEHKKKELRQEYFIDESTNTVRVENNKDSKLSKATGTRIAAILGMKSFSTPFVEWCVMEGIYEEPLTKELDKRYKAGEAVEQKMIQYLRELYRKNGGEYRILEPRDYGRFDRDIFPDEEFLGGRWDAVLVGKDGKIKQVIEVKSSANGNQYQWNNDAPMNYKLQVALYGYLEKVHDVMLACCFLEEENYENLDTIKLTPENVVFYIFNIYEEFPDFDQKIERIKQWYQRYVLPGISPPYNRENKKDMEVITSLMNRHEIYSEVGLMKDILKLEECDDRKKELINDQRVKEFREIEKKEKSIRERISAHFKNYNLDTRMIKGDHTEYMIKKGESRYVFNVEAMEKDGVLGKYAKEYPKYSIRIQGKKKRDFI